MSEFVSGNFGIRDIGSFEVISADWEIYQSVDGEGFPARNPKAGVINVCLVAGNGTDFNLLVKWAVSPTMTHEGNFILFDKTGGLIMIFNFYDGYCIRHRFVWESDPKTKYATAKIYITISAASIMFNQLSDAVVHNQWPGITPTVPTLSGNQQEAKTTLDFS